MVNGHISWNLRELSDGGRSVGRVTGEMSMKGLDFLWDYWAGEVEV